MSISIKRYALVGAVTPLAMAGFLWPGMVGAYAATSVESRPQHQ
jgi:hypothetical protein